MLTHIESGGTFKELCDFLEANAAEGLPENVVVFLRELENKLGACRARREAVLLEWADDALAHLIATSAGINKLCFHAGGNRLVVPTENLAAFSRAVNTSFSTRQPRITTPPMNSSAPITIATSFLWPILAYLSGGPAGRGNWCSRTT